MYTNLSKYMYITTAWSDTYVYHQLLNSGLFFFLPAACHLLQIMKRGLQRVGLPPPPPSPDNMALYELLLLCQHEGGCVWVEGEIILIWRA